MRIQKILLKDKSLDNSASLFMFGSSLFVFVLVTFLKEFIFQDKYFYDSYTIEYYISNKYFDFGDIAYANTAKFYYILGLTDRFFVIPLLSMLLYCAILFKMFRELPTKGIKLSNFLIFVFFVSMAMVYLTTFSKDCLVCLFIILPFMFLYKKKWGYIIIFILSFIYAFFFRQYWFLVAGYFFVFRILLMKKVPGFFIALSIFISYFFMVTAFQLLMGMNITDIRMGANADRIGSEDAATAITNFIPSSNIVFESINIFITFLTLIIPLPLIIHFSPIYLIVACCILSAMYQLRKIYLLENKSLQISIGTTNCLALLLALLVVQGVFEPDYGSYVRHLSPLYPIIFLMILPNSRQIEKYKIEQG